MRFLAGGFEDKADFVAFAEGNAIAGAQPMSIARWKGQPVDVGSVGAADVFYVVDIAFYEKFGVRPGDNL